MEYAQKLLFLFTQNQCLAIYACTTYTQLS